MFVHQKKKNSVTLYVYLIFLSNVLSVTHYEMWFPNPGQYDQPNVGQFFNES